MLKHSTANSFTIGQNSQSCFFEAEFLFQYYVPKLLRRRLHPEGCIGVKRRVRIGNPDPALISTSHVERTNLSVRLFTRRFTRYTMGYSKTLENLKHAVALFVAHFNFCRIHSAHGQTPAQNAGITDFAWDLADLLRITPN